MSARGGVAAARRPSSEQSEGLLELDRVDSRGRRWRRFCISGHEYHVNMSVLEPYLQVLSHGGQRSSLAQVVGGFISAISVGHSAEMLITAFLVLAGYYGDEMNAIILFTSCYLPENTVEDYDYVMDHLFRWAGPQAGRPVIR